MNKTFKNLFLGLLSFSSIVLGAQRDEAYDLLEDFTLNPGYFNTINNPALTGARGWLNMNASFTNYQPQVPFSDYDYSFAFDGRIRQWAFGFSGYHRAFGDQRRTTLHLMASRIWVTETGLLTVGAAISNTSHGYINSRFDFPDEIDPYYGFVKPTEQAGTLSQGENIALSFGATWLYKNLYISSGLLRGVKVLSLYENGTEFFDDRAHLFPVDFFNTLGYRYELGSSFRLLGIAEIQKSQYSDWQFSPGLNLSYDNLLFFGGSYQNFNEWEVEAGVRIVDHVSVLMQMGFPNEELADDYITPTYYRFGIQANL